MINIGDFVIIKHQYAWSKALEEDKLSYWEMDNRGYIKGQVIGTYGPWDHVPDSKFHWDIVPDCWIIERGGSCQIEEDRVEKDIARSRQWKLSLLTNDMSVYDNSSEGDYIIEKRIIEKNKKNRVSYDTSGMYRYPVPA